MLFDSIIPGLFLFNFKIIPRKRQKKKEGPLWSSLANICWAKRHAAVATMFAESALWLFLELACSLGRFLGMHLCCGLNRFCRCNRASPLHQSTLSYIIDTPHSPSHDVTMTQHSSRSFPVPPVKAYGRLMPSKRPRKNRRLRNKCFRRITS